jgi:NADPH:quinone reductase-like Zn-dependent oxidoreductase
LVNGAGGGVGHVVLRICLDKVGPPDLVVAVCSTKSEGWIASILKDHGTERVQIIDRKKVGSISHFTITYDETRFDAVIDCAGRQDLFNAYSAFLKEEKPYVSVGPRANGYTYLGMLSTIGSMARNMLWPMLLGGVPRPYVHVAAISNLEALQNLADMVERGKLKVHGGRLVRWEDVASVSTFTYGSVIRLISDRYMKERSMVTVGARLLLKLDIKMTKWVMACNGIGDSWTR